MVGRCLFFLSLGASWWCSFMRLDHLTRRQRKTTINMIYMHAGCALASAFIPYDHIHVPTVTFFFALRLLPLSQDGRHTIDPPRQMALLLAITSNCPTTYAYNNCSDTYMAYSKPLFMPLGPSRRSARLKRHPGRTAEPCQSVHADEWTSSPGHRFHVIRS